MATLLVSSKGQIVLPAALRRRMGLGAGSRLEAVEEPDGLKLRVVRSVATTSVESLAGLLKAPARGVPRFLDRFDPAALVARVEFGKPAGRPAADSVSKARKIRTSAEALPASKASKTRSAGPK
jgi:antitoxin PrlF